MRWSQLKAILLNGRIFILFLILVILGGLDCRYEHWVDGLILTLYPDNPPGATLLQSCPVTSFPKGR